MRVVFICSSQAYLIVYYCNGLCILSPNKHPQLIIKKWFELLVGIMLLCVCVSVYINHRIWLEKADFAKLLLTLS